MQEELTWTDLLAWLQSMSDEQLQQPAVVEITNPHKTLACPWPTIPVHVRIGAHDNEPALTSNQIADGEKQ